MNTIDFQPTKFEDNGEHSEKFQYISYNRMLDGDIQQFFVTKEAAIFYYTEGIEEEVFIQHELNDPANFPKFKDCQDQILKIISPEGILSNEINVQYRIGRIMNIESVDKPFYAVRDDQYLGEEQDYITFYKVQLVRK
ncbi:hypothetical protein [Belliella pelovolcani]|uniref:hypothetical protein n=1 Tax=Belliella pelovolcani TaxID=529505 RepID=UPI00391AFDFF